MKEMFCSVSGFFNDLKMTLHACDSSWIDQSRARSLRAIESTSAAFGGFIFGATGTGRSATSPGFGATCSSFLATSGGFAAGGAAAEGECGPCDQAGDTESGQDLLEVSNIHNGLLMG